MYTLSQKSSDVSGTEARHLHNTIQVCYHCTNVLHHHQFLLSLKGHRASTKHRYLVLFLAIFLASPQLFPFSNASLWTDLHHVCLGLPLLLFPCGFQTKASHSMALFPFLSVCPFDSRGHLSFLCPSPKFFI